MKIAFNNSIFFFQKNGGISRYFTSIAEELIKKNQEVKVIAPINKNNLLKGIPSENKISFYLKRYPSFKFLEDTNNKITNHYVQKFEPNIFHETYYSNYPYDYNKSKKIITVYDLIHEKFSNYFTNEKIIKKKEIIKNYDHYICISENTKKDLINIYKIPEKKISVIYLSGSHYRNSNLIIEKKIKEKKFFLYVGSRGVYKNFKLIVECFRNNKNLNEHKIICFGGGQFTIDEKKYFNKLNISHVDGDDNILVKLYKEAKCLILPSEYEGFGIPALEAMELGCPVLSSNTAALKETCGDAALYFNPYSEEELMHKINLLTLNDSLRNELIKKGLERAELFSWKKCAEQTLTLYNSIL